MRSLFKSFVIFGLMLASYNSIDAQTKRNNVRSTQKQSPRQFYVTLKLGTGYANHSSINVYSKLGVDAKIACKLSTQNVYKAEGDFVTSTMATPQVWCKLFSLEGKFIGYISSKELIKCEAPVAPKFEMVHVKGASYMMGDNTDPEASPEHPVTVSDFEMCKH